MFRRFYIDIDVPTEDLYYLVDGTAPDDPSPVYVAGLLRAKELIEATLIACARKDAAR